MQDPNRDEYRQLVGAPDQYDVAVGALIEGTCLSRNPGNDYYNIVTGATYGQTLDHFMGQMVCFKETQAGSPVPDPIPHITAGYKFKDCVIVANSTCFYIGNGLIVTAGHSIFEDDGPNIKATVAGMKVVFGLTNANCNNKTIPAAKVFGIERVCFGQNEPFISGQPNADRADWAILKLDVDPMSPQLPAPLALRKWVGSEQINGAWNVGHPWGIGLTLSSPPDDKGYACTNGENSLLHNLYVAPASSGGPLFSKQNEVVGIVASGVGDVLYSRGFYWLPLGSDITPVIAPNQTFRATKTNIWHSLTHTNTACFVGLQLPSIPATAAEKQLVVEILFGNGDEAHWSSVTIIDQANVPNDSIQTIINCATITGANPNFRPWLIRAIKITFTHPVAAGGVARARGALQMPKIPALIFGCRDSEDQTEPANWTILLSAENINYRPAFEGQPAVAGVVECPIFLPRAWKTITDNHIGPLSLTGPDFSLTPWQAARPRNQ